MKRTYFGTLLAVLATGPAGLAADAKPPPASQAAIAAVEKIISDKLKFPGSARFTDMHAYPMKGGRLVIVCGLVSGEREFGGRGHGVLFIAAARDGKAWPEEAEFYDSTLMSDYPVPKRCDMAAHGNPGFYEP